MEDNIEISVVIVSYNTSHIIGDTVKSVLEQENVKYELTIIDNNSPDNSQEYLMQYQSDANVILNKDNIGSGQAVNQGYRLAKGRICYLLNPDAVLQSKTALRDLVDYMDAHPEYGLVGTKVLEDNGQTNVLPRKKYPCEKHITQDLSKLPGDIAWVLGASTAMPKKIFEMTGGYAKEFFLYGDEVDFCIRLRKHGYQVGYCENVVVSHLGGGSEHNTKAYAYWIKKQAGVHNFILNHYTSDDVQRILHIEARRSKFRMRLLNFKKKFFGLTPKQQEKFDRYQAIYDTSKQLLRERQYQVAPRVEIAVS